MQMDSKKVQNEHDVILDLFNRYPDLQRCRSSIEAAGALLVDCFMRGGKLLVCGNGGSAADSEHIVGELMKSFRFKRRIDEGFRQNYLAVHGCLPPDCLEGALPAIALVSHTAFSTAFSNDASAEGVFAQQVYAYGRRGDALLALSTSGNSKNVTLAAKVAHACGMQVVALTGFAPSALSDQADVTVAVPETETYRVQELHLPVYHALCAAVEAELF